MWVRELCIKSQGRLEVLVAESPPGHITPLLNEAEDTRERKRKMSPHVMHVYTSLTWTRRASEQLKSANIHNGGVS